MKKAASLLIAACLLGGCASLPPTAKSIHGQWHFAHVRKAQSLFGQLPPPPQFDTISFAQPNKINLKASLEKWSFDGTFLLSGNDLSYEFHPPDVKEPVRHKLKCALVDQGNSLILTHEQTEMVYYRPDRFYPNEIAGNWITKAEGKSEIMLLGKDGSYLMVQSNVIGHYRLWPSRYGKAMTAVVFIPGHGGYLMIWKWEQKADRLTLTPISWKGPVPEGAVTWTLRAKEEPPNQSIQATK